MAQLIKDDISKYSKMIENIPGDFAEIGTANGNSFILILPVAKAQKKMLHGFDSFYGMGIAGDFDEGYLEGQFSVGGAKNFSKLITDKDFSTDDFRLHAGWVPQCFRGCDDLRFSFVYLDLDYYNATREALPWIWSRINPGGILILDDYFQGNPINASKAVDEWLPTSGCQIIKSTKDQLFVKRPL